MNTLILNPDEALRLDYEHNWKHLVSYDDYLSIIEQRKSYTSNSAGYERVVR